MEKNLGHATAYGYAKSKGYSGTEDEFAELMADYASVGQSAAQSAEQAAASASSASGSAATAASAAQTATSKASEALTAAGTATTKASEASTSADTASAAATSASTSAQTATTKASTATTKASEAAESEAAALSAKTDAEAARDAAAQSASEAAASAESIDPETLEHKAYGAYVVESASGAVTSFADGADSIPMKDVLVHIEPVQAGSGDPSPDNVRPITGWTGAKVTRTGRNLCDQPIGRWIWTTDGQRFDNIEGKYCATEDRMPVKGGEQYVISFTDSGQNSAVYFVWFNEDGFIKADTKWSVPWTATAPQNATKVALAFLNNESYTGEPKISNVQLEPGSTATDYEPYSGQTYDITFPTKAGTVYGGLLDVINGELIVNKVMVTLDGTQALAPNGKTSISSRFGLNVAGKAVGERNILSNMFYAPPVFTDSVGLVYGRVASSYVEFFLSPDIEQTTDAGKAWFAENPTQLCYELASPITYSLTPQEITSLLGTNNVWADTGDIEVEYRADTKMYVDAKVAAAVSALS